MTNHDEPTICRSEDEIVNRNNWQDERNTKQWLMVFDWLLAEGMFFGSCDQCMAAIIA
jgi:hypothetical protein